MRPAVEWSWGDTDLLYDADRSTYYLQQYGQDEGYVTRESTMYPRIVDAINAYWEKTAAWGEWH